MCYLKRRNLFPNPTHLPFSELLPLTVDIVGDTRPVHMYRPEICMALGWPIKIEHSGVIFNVFFFFFLSKKSIAIVSNRNKEVVYHILFSSIFCGIVDGDGSA